MHHRFLFSFPVDSILTHAHLIHVGPHPGARFARHCMAAREAQDSLSKNHVEGMIDYGVWKHPKVAFHGFASFPQRLCL